MQSRTPNADRTSTSTSVLETPHSPPYNPASVPRQRDVSVRLASAAPRPESANGQTVTTQRSGRSQARPSLRHSSHTIPVPALFFLGSSRSIQSHNALADRPTAADEDAQPASDENGQLQCEDPQSEAPACILALLTAVRPVNSSTSTTGTAWKRGGLPLNKVPRGDIGAKDGEDHKGYPGGQGPKAPRMRRLQGSLYGSGVYSAIIGTGWIPIRKTRTFYLPLSRNALWVMKLLHPGLQNAVTSLRPSSTERLSKSSTRARTSPNTTTREASTLPRTFPDSALSGRFGQAGQNLPPEDENESDTDIKDEDKSDNENTPDDSDPGSMFATAFPSPPLSGRLALGEDSGDTEYQIRHDRLFQRSGHSTILHLRHTLRSRHPVATKKKCTPRQSAARPSAPHQRDEQDELWDFYVAMGREFPSTNTPTRQPPSGSMPFGFSIRESFGAYGVHCSPTYDMSFFASKVHNPGDAICP
ncbi:hypothetical protein B0T10DRAFT_548715 [Thelonectria olida]|uniref:Uncharacterized protein n=1 Tax=Thelonectria olida TaxID=1576542 RepID=A0A9P8W694_9HYPO|nr:hypothetical protein B0T10DRAFT_548715 [Thelonectria olida]